MRTVTFNFDDETVVVTGAASGIGRAIALEFGQAGATVIIADIREDPLDPAASVPTHEAITSSGGSAVFVESDVADPDDLTEVIDTADELGGVDVMVNNAGIIDRSSLLDATPEAFDRLWSVNVNGVLFGCQIAAADMIDRGEPGVIVNTASISSDLAMYDHVLYDATKGAVKMITRCAALDLSRHDIRVNAIAPGFTATNLSEGGPDALEDAVADGAVVKPVPLGRAGQPEDLAPAVLYLCTDAASYVTGELFHIDGGYQVI